MATLSFDVGSREIKFKGIFIFNELLLTILRWLKSKSFVKKEENDLNEEYYIQEELPNGSKNVSIKWNFELKEDLFVKYLEIKFNALGLKKSEIVHDNRKIEVEQGEITISLKAKLDFDPEERFKSNFFIEKFFEYIWMPINKNIVKNTLIGYTQDLDKLYDTIRVFFELKEDKIGDTGVLPRGFKE